MSAIDSALDFLKRQLAAASGAIESITDAWNNKVNELKARAHDFTELYTRLESKGEQLPVDSPLYKEYKSVMADADKARSVIQSITQQIDAASMSTRALGRGGLMSGMEAVPLLAPIPLAIIAGAITVLGIQINKMLSVERQIDAALAAGADPTKVALSVQPKNIIESVIGRGGLLSNPVVLIGLVGLGWIMWPEIKKRLFK